MTIANKVAKKAPDLLSSVVDYQPANREEHIMRLRITPTNSIGRGRRIFSSLCAGQRPR